jgi:hypothetical protein
LWQARILRDAENLDENIPGRKGRGNRACGEELRN